MKSTIVEGIPNWAASYICNADPSGLEENDLKIVDDFIRALKEKGVRLISPIDEGEYFTRTPAFGLAVVVLDWWAIVE